MPIEVTPNIFQNVVVVLSVLIVLMTVLGAFRAGVLRSIRFGSLEFIASPGERQDTQRLLAAIGPEKDRIPFETEQLARFYAQVLSQSKISFWFSLIFASLGFVVIAFAIITFFQEKISQSVVQVVSGAIVEAVAALFFAQSRRAQDAMASFFDKLRTDRQQAESRTLCDTIKDGDMQDRLRLQLSLYYSGIPDFAVIAKDVIAEKTK